jgi:tetratricopeptide (TPR) repeat protein
VLRDDSTQYTALLMRGIVWYDLDSLWNAAALFFKATTIDTTDAVSWLWLASCFVESGESTYGLWAAEEAVKRDPSSGTAHYLKSRALWDGDASAAALDEARSAVALDSSASRFHAHEARVALSLGLNDEARAAFLRAVALSPEDPALGKECARAMLRAGDWDGAAGQSRRVMELGGDTTAALIVLNVACREHGDREEEQRSFEALLARCSSRGQALALLSFEYVPMKMQKEAMSLAREAIALNPEDPLCHYAHGAACSMQPDAACVCTAWHAIMRLDDTMGDGFDRYLSSWPALSGLCADAQDDYRFAREVMEARDGDAAFTHPGTGLRFPKTLHGASRDKLVVYPEPKDGMSISYTLGDSLDTRAWVFVALYPAQAGTAGPSIFRDTNGRTVMDPSGDGQQNEGFFKLNPPSRSYETEYRKAQSDIVEKWRDADRVAERRRMINGNLDGPVGMNAVYRAKFESGIEAGTDVSLFVYHGYFVRINATWPRSAEGDVFLFLSDFINALEWEK